MMHNGIFVASMLLTFLLLAIFLILYSDRERMKLRIIIVNLERLTFFRAEPLTRSVQVGTEKHTESTYPTKRQRDLWRTHYNEARALERGWGVFSRIPRYLKQYEERRPR